MGPQPGSQSFGHREGDQVIRYGQQFAPLLLDPLGGIGLSALWAGAVIAGVIDKMIAATVGATIDLATHRGGAAVEDCLHCAAMGGKDFRAELPFILRPVTPQHLGQRHHRERSPLAFAILVKPGQRDLRARLTDRGQVGVNDRGVQSVVTQINADLAQGHPFFEQVSGIAMP